MPIDWSETKSSSQTDAGHSDWVLRYVEANISSPQPIEKAEVCSRGDTWQYKRGDYPS